MSSSLRIQGMTTAPSVISVSMDCPLLKGSSIYFKWYKNGEDITDSSNPSTGYLKYMTKDGESTVGIYQCFAMNSVGSDYSIKRLIDNGKFG